MAYVARMPPEFAPQSDPLWRYLTFDKLEFLLTRRSLFLSAAGRQSDPEEGYVDAITAAEVAQWLEPWKAARRQIAIETLSEPSLTGYLRHLDTASPEAMTENFRRQALLSCWAQAPGEIRRMWEDYAPGPLSVALVSSVDRIDQVLRGLIYDLDSALFWYGRVLYPQNSGLPASIESMNSVTVGFVKRPSYSWEREFRVVWMDERHPPIGRSFPVALDQLLDRIVLSPEATDADRASLLETVARFAPGLIVSQSEFGEHS